MDPGQKNDPKIKNIACITSPVGGSDNLILQIRRCEWTQDKKMTQSKSPIKNS